MHVHQSRATNRAPRRVCSKAVARAADGRRCLAVPSGPPHPHSAPRPRGAPQPPRAPGSAAGSPRATGRGEKGRARVRLRENRCFAPVREPRPSAVRGNGTGAMLRYAARGRDVLREAAVHRFTAQHVRASPSRPPLPRCRGAPLCPAGARAAVPSRALTSAAARPGHGRASSSSSARRCGQPPPAIPLLARRPAELGPAPELCPRPARGFWPRGCRLAPSSPLPAPRDGRRAGRGGAVRATPLLLPPPPPVSPAWGTAGSRRPSVRPSALSGRSASEEPGAFPPGTEVSGGGAAPGGTT